MPAHHLLALLLLATLARTAPPTHDALLAAQQSALQGVSEDVTTAPAGAPHIHPRGMTHEIRPVGIRRSHVPGHVVNEPEFETRNLHARGSAGHRRAMEKVLKRVKRESEVAALEVRDEVLQPRDEVEPRAEQYPLQQDKAKSSSAEAKKMTTTTKAAWTSSTATKTWTSTAQKASKTSDWSSSSSSGSNDGGSNNGGSSNSGSSGSSSGSGGNVDYSTVTADHSSESLSSYWRGVSSYYVFALEDSDRYAVLDAIKAGGFKVVRIFIASVMQNNKGSNNPHIPDLEPNSVGDYDDTILYKIDQLMHDCYVRGLKLMIACDDRYALGFWSTNSYAQKFNIVKSGSSGVQKVTNAASFYTSSSAIQAFENRLEHILKHRNKLMDNKTWAELDNVIYAFEPQNEPQGYMSMASESWVCDRAASIEKMLPENSTILIGSGGGITTKTSLEGWATQCASIDIVSVHDYGTDAGSTVAAIKQARDNNSCDQHFIMGEWGMTGNNKAGAIANFVSAFKAAGIPHMYWEVVKPGKGSSDFEVWTDEPAWKALTS